MNSKERVRHALRKEPVDRPPVFMWFHPRTRDLLAGMLEIPPGDVSEAFGDDVRQAWVNNNHAMEGIVHDRDGEGHTDYWGIEWVKEGAFNQIVGFPLAGASKEEVLTYAFPTGRVDELLDLLRPAAELKDRYFIGCDVSPCVFEMYWRLRGLDRTLFEIAAEPELTETMFGRCADFAIALSVEACRRFELDWLWTGDDVASQNAMLMSPATWRNMIKPHLKRICDVGKTHGLPVAYHCCGAVREIIEDLIEIGVDVLNPIQCNCRGMDALALKRDFGDRLAFMGGVDTQGLLPRGSADDVRRATATLVEGMTRDGGGFILAASHTVPPETPIDNIFAMYEEVGIPRQAVFDAAADIRRRLAAESSTIPG